MRQGQPGHQTPQGHQGPKSASRAPFVFLVLAALGVLGVLDCSAAYADPPDFRLFGSIGNETHFMAQNPDSPLNPSGFLDLPSRSNSLDFNLYSEVVPETKTWKLQLKLRGENEWRRDRTTTRLEISEAAFGVSAASWLDLQVGRSIEKWGTGYAWNPTGVVNPRKNPGDPNDRRGTYRGVDNIRADFFVKDWNLSILGVSEIDWEGQNGKNLVAAGWAFRAYRLCAGIDLSLTASGGNGLPNSQGISFSRVVGNALEVHGEFAAFQDSLRMRPESGSFQLREKKHADVLLGGQYTFPHNLNLVFEYYHSGAGLSPLEWVEYERMVGRALAQLPEGDPRPLYEANIQFSLLGMARDYAFGRLYWLFGHDKLEAELLALSSLRDGYSLLRPGITWKIHPDWSVYVLYSELVGGAKTEFEYLQVHRLADFGLRYHF